MRAKPKSIEANIIDDWLIVGSASQWMDLQFLRETVKNSPQHYFAQKGKAAIAHSESYGKANQYQFG